MIDRQKGEQYHEMLNNGEMYDSVDDEFIAYQHELVQRLNDFNRTDETPEGLKERDEILKEICGTYGEDLYVIHLHRRRYDDWPKLYVGHEHTPRFAPSAQVQDSAQ